ncbi:MAG: DUF423 domain-containing protein [Pseudomonadota bacterium]
MVLGAFGAHGLASLEGMTPRMLETWDTAVFYHLVHGVVLLLLAVIGMQKAKIKWLFRIYLIFIGGMLLFSGSLYALVLGAPSWVGPITPLGGTLFIAGWTMLSLSALTSAKNQPD